MKLTKPLDISCMFVAYKLFYAKNSGFKWFREQVMEKGCHFGWFLSNTCPTQMVNSVRVKPKLVCEFFADGWLLLRCEEVLAIIHLVFMDKNPFLGLNSCLNDATMAIMLHQSNHQYFMMKICSHRKVEVQYCDKRSLFPRVTARGVVIFTYFDRFPPHEGDRIYHHCSCIQVRVGPTYNSS